MEKIIDLNSLTDSFFKKKRPIVVLGFFDGVHKGHQMIIRECIKRKKEKGGSSVVFTFKNHPSDILAGKDKKKLILPFEEKVKLIYSLGVDYIVATEFDRSFSNIAPNDFCDNILYSKLNAIDIIAGQNFRFGKDGKGNIDYMKKFFLEKKITVKEIPLLEIDGTVISSTVIRNLLKEGNVLMASKFLGREPYVTGKVIKEKGLGRKIGYPTINLRPPGFIILPKDGVYAGKVKKDSARPLISAINIGKNPTFMQKDRTIEAHILGFKGDLYNKSVKILFSKRIRDEERFKNAKILTKQIEKDIIETRDFFNKFYATDL